MAITLSSSLWLAVLATVPQIHGVTWPLIQTDVGNYPDSNTVPLLTDLNNGVNPDTIGPNGWTALHIAAGLDKPNMAAVLKQKGAVLYLSFQNRKIRYNLSCLEHILQNFLSKKKTK